LTEEGDYHAQGRGISAKKKMLAMLGVTLGLCGAAAAYDHNLKANYVFDGTSYFDIDWPKESVPFVI
jgi:hypothetical protein